MLTIVRRRPATVTPVLVYPDVRAAVRGSRPRLDSRSGWRIGETHRAQLRAGLDGAVSSSTSVPIGSPRWRGSTHLIKVRVPDVMQHSLAPVTRGRVVVGRLTTWEYGERSCQLEDPAGHRWS
jgi:uncharacterized glyoxalase superfamily protein PhnB